MQVFYKTGFLENFAKYTRQHVLQHRCYPRNFQILYENLFLKKFQSTAFDERKQLIYYIKRKAVLDIMEAIISVIIKKSWS